MNGFWSIKIPQSTCIFVYKFLTEQMVRQWQYKIICISSVISKHNEKRQGNSN